MKFAAAGTAAVLLTLLSAASADAKPHRYVGVHAINADDGMCYIEAPHIHAYAPHKASVLFRTEGGDHHFIGDPAAFEYDGPRHSYHGHHPVFVAGAEHYCYLDGAHFHHDAPPVGARFEIKGDVHWYVGPKSKRYKQHLHRRRATNAFYAEVHYARPVIVVEPPAAYTGVVVAAPGVSASVDVLLPTFSLTVGGGGHGHFDHKHKYKHKHKHKRSKHHRAKSRKIKRKHRRSHGKRKGRRWKF